MAVESVIVQVPHEVYARLKERAQQTQRSVEEELVGTLMEAMPLDDSLPIDVATAIAPMDTMPDEELRQVAQASQLSSAAAELLEELNDKCQREGLTADEAQIVDALRHQYDRAMLVRAEALARLKERGHDISDLLTPTPIAS